MVIQYTKLPDVNPGPRVTSHDPIPSERGDSLVGIMSVFSVPDGSRYVWVMLVVISPTWPEVAPIISHCFCNIYFLPRQLPT